MADWRVYGRVMATLRSSYGFHMVVHAKRMRFGRFHGRDVPYLPFLCRDPALSQTLETQIRVSDRVHIAGVIEPRTRPQSPIIKRDWDMIVTEARVLRFSNFFRRLWARPSPRDSAAEDDDPQSSKS